MVWTLKELDLKRDNETENWLINELICKPNHVFLFHGDGNTQFGEAKKNFFIILNKNGFKYNSVKVFNKGNNIYYELYVVDQSLMHGRST